MNDYIAIVLMSKLLDINYIQKFGGIVQTIQRTALVGKEKVNVKIPVAKAFRQYKNITDRIEVLKCGLTSKILEDFIPESKLSGMVYFEDNGIGPDINKRHSSIDFYTSKLRLVGWFNQSLISNDFNNMFRTQAMNEILQAIITDRPENRSILKMLKVSVDNIPKADASIFSDYDYNEAQTQFITAPYDFFAVDLNVSFGIPKKCLIKFTPEEIIC